MTTKRRSRKALTDYEILSSTRPMCSLPMASGQPCTTKPTWFGIRVDGTSFLSCTRHRNRLADQIARRPEVYSRVEWGQI